MSNSSEEAPLGDEYEMIGKPQEEVSRMKREIERMALEKELMHAEIRSLKAEARSYQKELEASGPIARTKELGTVGKEVRMRYLELHRRRMGRRIGDAGYSHIKSGDRAVHRGRPLADAQLYHNGERSDPDVYEDLYGVSPKTM
jgi:hypothetical protein